MFKIDSNIMPLHKKNRSKRIFIVTFPISISLPLVHFLTKYGQINKKNYNPSFMKASSKFFLAITF